MKGLLHKITSAAAARMGSIGVALLIAGALLFVLSLLTSSPNGKDDLLLLGLAAVLTGVYLVYKGMRREGGY